MVAIQVYTLRMNISKPDSDFAKNTSAVMINKLARRIIMNDRNKKTEEKNSVDLTSVISTAIQVPGVKVNRDSFLREQFKNLSPNDLTRIIEIGPIEAGYSRNDLKKKANRIIKERTAISTSASFVAGLPGGLAMAATIPADMIQFYGVALRMAQELVYLYGEEDLWCDGTPDGDKVTNQLTVPFSLEKLSDCWPQELYCRPADKEKSYRHPSGPLPLFPYRQSGQGRYHPRTAGSGPASIRINRRQEQ